MKTIPVVTIDGPAASGKTSVSRELAQRLGWSWVSTGAFYRGLAYVAIKEKANLDNEKELVALVHKANWQVCMSPDRTQFLYNDKDVTDEIYKEEIGSAASQIGRHKKFRESLITAQRNCVSKVNGLIAEGRDCGTVIFPMAQVKFYLTAKSESRAQRRADEQGANLMQTLEAQKQRDKQDKNRAAAPLQIPENAHIVDTSEWDLQQVIEHLDSIVRAELKI
ncbi:MAG: (d)CMP kinase [Bdellovibrionaceae bacterium]|nr:(d)CMP kinase [Pseudobdellovibrionaceae bacterium]